VPRDIYGKVQVSSAPDLPPDEVGDAADYCVFDAPSLQSGDNKGELLPEAGQRGKAAKNRRRRATRSSFCSNG